MKQICIITVFFTLFSTFVAHSQEWQSETIGNGIKPTIAVDQNDNPNIAFMTEALSGFVKHAVKNNNSFTVSEVHTGYFYGPLDIAIDRNNFPRIVYHDHFTEDLAHAKRNGTSWVIDQIISPGHDGWDGSIVIDEFNKSHIASVDPGIGIEYVYEADSNWVVEAPGSGGFTYGFSTSILLDNNGNPHICYYKSNTEELQYAFKNDSVWQIETVIEGGLFPSMIMKNDGEVKIAFVETVFGSLGAVSIASKTDTGWVSIKIDTLFEINLNEAPRHLVDYKYHNDTEYLAYSDQKFIYFATKLPHAWKIEEAVNLIREPSITLGQQISLDLDSGNNPHISYFELSSNQEGGVVKYATKTVVSELLINCPPDINFDCTTDTSNISLGEPIITNNPGTSISISLEEVEDLKDCLIENDVITRTWSISNDLNQTGSCIQTIRTRHDRLAGTDFPPDQILSGICYEELGSLDLGSISGFCEGLSANYQDSLTNSNCDFSLIVDRNWEITDNCGNLIFDYTQKIQIDFPPSLDIKNIEITADNGNSTGSVSFDIQCGIPPFRYVWSNGATSPSLENLESGLYSITLLDDLQCIDVMDFEVPKLINTNLLSGNFSDVNGEHLEGVNVSLNFVQDSFPVIDCETTASDFNYCVFDTTDVTGTLEICFSKEDAAASKVSAIDVVKAQRIILGLVNPCMFNLIAGDVNNSGTLTAADLVIMQRVILGFDDNFPVDRNWTFFRNDQLADCETFAAGDLPITDLLYTGVKIGDLACDDGEVNADQLPIEIRSEKPVILSLNDITLNAGNIYEIELWVLAEQPLIGIQSALKVTSSDIEIIGVDITMKNQQLMSNWNQSSIKFIQYDHKNIKENDNHSLLRFHILVNTSTSLKEAIELNSSFLNVAYDPHDREVPILLNFTDSPKKTETHPIIYPNPFNDHLKLILPSQLDSEDLEITLFDLTGKALAIKKIQSNNAFILEVDNAENLHQGIYFLYLNNATYSNVFKVFKTN